MPQARQHWIYVLGGTEFCAKARKWRDRKTRQGKAYAVIDGAPSGSHLHRLAAVENDDVLYLFADAVSEGRLGEWEITPDQLVRQLHAEGLDVGHRSLKIFASYSGDQLDTGCFAELFYTAAHHEFPRAVVFGYRGQVDVEGFDGHKTAGLDPGETLQEMNREQWLKRGARAMDNRVQFPPVHHAEHLPGVVPAPQP